MMAVDATNPYVARWTAAMPHGSLPSVSGRVCTYLWLKKGARRPPRGRGSTFVLPALPANITSRDLGSGADQPCRHVRPVMGQVRLAGVGAWRMLAAPWKENVFAYRTTLPVRTRRGKAARLGVRALPCAHLRGDDPP
jgi:hypothetical protein